MTYYKRPHPWDSGFAIPDYIRAEAPGARGGVHTTMQLPRGTFGPVVRAKPWKSRYALPEYVEKEPVGRGAVATQQLRRKHIPGELPPLGQADVEAQIDLDLLEQTPLPDEGMVEEGEVFPELYVGPDEDGVPTLASKSKKGAPGWVLPAVVGLGAIWYFTQKKGR